MLCVTGFSFYDTHSRIWAEAAIEDATISSQDAPAQEG